MTWATLHRAVVTLLRNLVDALPQHERTMFLREVAQSALALAAEVRPPSGVMKLDLPDPDDSRGNGE
jgi:hypothetical protein